VRHGSAIVKGTIELGSFAVPYRIYESKEPRAEAWGSLLLFFVLNFSINT